MPLAGRACSNTTAGAHWSSRLREVDVLHFWLRRRVSTACLARIRLQSRPCPACHHAKRRRPTSSPLVLRATRARHEPLYLSGQRSVEDFRSKRWTEEELRTGGKTPPNPAEAGLASDASHVEVLNPVLRWTVEPNRHRGHCGRRNRRNTARLSRPLRALLSPLLLTPRAASVTPA